MENILLQLIVIRILLNGINCVMHIFCLHECRQYSFMIDFIKVAD